MNKFEIWDETIKHLGSSPQEIMRYWLANNMLDRGCLEKVLESKIEFSGEVFPHLRIGWYMFANGKFSPYPDTFSVPIGVVAWLKPNLEAKAGERGFIVLFNEYYGVWSDHNLLYLSRDTSDGEKNTQNILQKAKTLKLLEPVAEFCEATNKLIGGANAFIPAYKQLDKIASSYSVIRDAFEAVGKTFHPFLFSSTEVDCKHVMCMDMTTASVLKRVKTDATYMYPIIVF